MWQKKSTRQWQQTSKLRNLDWKRYIRPVIENYADRTPGSYLVDRNNVLSWNFDNADTDHGAMRANELKDELADRIHNMNLQIIEGKSLIEIKPSAMNKGIAALNAISEGNYDMVIAVGDDYTDEYLFEQLAESAFTVRVGMKKTHARYYCKSHEDVRGLLRSLGKTSREFIKIN
jgi:trehalose 6-phosphate synthase/phosphatase